MEDSIHIMKADWENVVELAQTYLEDYAETWWTYVRHESGKIHGYLWEDFQEWIKPKFVPKLFQLHLKM